MTTTPTARTSERIEHGDWQTPPELAERVLRVLRARGVRAGVVLEPTCGRGAFLAAAGRAFEAARLCGYELSEAHLEVAAREVPGAELHRADFFAVDWDAALRALPDPLLVVGNPPWVTSATLGALASRNVPEKANFKAHRGLDAVTGKANFDLAEYVIVRLLAALRGRSATLAMLCKSSVARRVIEHAVKSEWAVSGATYRIDARAHFDAAVDAVLLVVDAHGEQARAGGKWEAFEGLEHGAAVSSSGVVDGVLCSDVEAFVRTRGLAGSAEIEWRSGVKHDCAQVMELRREGSGLRNGLGERVELEDEFLYPMLKGSDVANGRGVGERVVVVTQRALGGDTSVIRERAPKTWAYLCAHGARLDARKSSIYRGGARFAMFGVGEYSFAPYKVAICGLYKRLAFEVVGSVDGRPVMLDDTCYFVPCEERAQAEAIARGLNGERAQEFLRSRVFWDAKRPVNKAVLQSLSIEAVLRGE